MNTKTKQLACALAGAPLPKPWWKSIEVDYYFDWLSWGIIVEIASARRGYRSPLRGWRGFMFQIGPWGMAFRWPRIKQEWSNEAMSEGQEAAGGMAMMQAKAPNRAQASSAAGFITVKLPKRFDLWALQQLRKRSP